MITDAASYFEALRAPSECELVEVDGLRLPLRRYPAAGERAGNSAAVLLLHPGSSCSDAYLIPNGGIVHYLTGRGWDVWTLDWRSSSQVVDSLLAGAPLGGSVAAERALFTLDRAAEHDLPLAIDRVRAHPSRPATLSLVGHCLGAAVIAMATARGVLEGRGVDRIVLMTLALFYEAPWDGWIKAEDFFIERVVNHDGACRGISPRSPEAWPGAFQRAYARWPKPWLPDEHEPGGEMFRRLTFMFGQPYVPENLAPEVGTEILCALYGHMHLGLFLHAGQLVRRGFSAPLDAPDVIDRQRFRVARYRPPEFETDLRHEHFDDKRVTLITGAENRLWHRDSIDLMYEWLLSNTQKPPERRRFKKHVLPEYGHLDLLWGRSARTDVYPLIAAGIE